MLPTRIDAMFSQVKYGRLPFASSSVNLTIQYYKTTTKCIQ